jgi:hypothetical protein
VHPGNVVSKIENPGGDDWPGNIADAGSPVRANRSRRLNGVGNGHDRNLSRNYDNKIKEPELRRLRLKGRG